MQFLHFLLISTLKYYTALLKKGAFTLLFNFFIQLVAMVMTFLFGLYNITEIGLEDFFISCVNWSAFVLTNKPKVLTTDFHPDS